MSEAKEKIEKIKAALQEIERLIHECRQALRGETA